MIVNVVSDSVYFPKGHGVHTAFLNMVNMLKKKGVTVLINSFTQKADITHIHTLGAFGFTAMMTRRPLVISAHIVPASLSGSLIGEKYWMTPASNYIKFFYNKANLVFAVGDEVKKDLEKLGVKSPIKILYNAIDTDTFHQSPELRKEGRKILSVPENATLIVGAGQVQTRKGIDDFIKVAKAMPDALFYWFGGQPFSGITATSPELTALLKDLPSNVKFPGTFPYDQMPALFNAADIFFFPSRQETQGLVIIEGGACGLPLVLRDLPEYKLLYKKDYIACKDDKEFETAIKKLLKNKTEYKKAAQEARNLSLRFSFDTMADTVLQEYQKLIDKKV